MNRRDMMRVLGGALALPLLAALPAERLDALGRAAHRRARARAGGFTVLDPHQAETVATIAEMTLPETDTPGARAAHVPEFIDLMLAEWFADDDRARFLAGLADVDERSRDLFGADFLTTSEPQRAAILSGLDAEVAALRRAKAKPEKHFFHQIKSFTLYGFYMSEIAAADQPIQKRCYACNEYSGKFFVNDRDNPYTFDPGKPFHWIRGRQVGGRSIMWGRQVYRWSDLDFEANAKDGFGADWPIRYADIAPWYDYVEEAIGVSGAKLGLAQLPDGKFLPPMPLNCAEQVVQEAVARRFGGERVVTIGRCAVITVPHGGRAACHYCGPCERGCITRSYFSSVSVTLPLAQATGRVTLRPYSVVHSVIYDEKKDRAVGVRVIDAQTREPLEFHARVVFLCASALESTRLLLNSATPRFPTGLAEL